MPTKDYSFDRKFFYFNSAEEIPDQGSNTYDEGYVTFTCHRGRVGSGLQQHRYLIAVGENATTDMVADESLASMGSSTFSFRYKSGPEDPIGFPTGVTILRSEGALVYPFGPDGSSYPLNPLGFETSRSIAAERFTQRLRSTQTAIEGGVFLGELSETLHQIRNPAKALRERLGKYVSDLPSRRKGKKRMTQRQARRWIANSWLEYVYGVAPLISDVKGGIEAVKKFGFSGYRKTIAIKAKGDEETSYNVTDDFPQYGATYVKFYPTIYYFARSESSVYGKVVVANSSPVSAEFRNFGISWDSIVPTIWELIPYSFVVDYFTNVGKVLSSYTDLTSDLLWVSGTDRSMAKRLITGAYLDKEYTENVLGDRYLSSVGIVAPSFMQQRLVYRHRTVDIGSYVKLRFTLPGFSLKWINLTALARSVTQSRGSFRLFY